MAFFSVVTSVYNGEEYIRRAVLSVIGQLEKDFEYIIVDNGSFDNTQSILRRIVSDNPDCNIKIISIKTNKGISGGRNAGIQQAEGKYVCFLDADDYWYPEKLKIVKETIQKREGIQAYCHWEDHVKVDEKKAGEYRDINNKDAYMDLLTMGNCLSTSAMTIERQMIKEINGFDINLVSGEEDYDCWLRLAKIGCRFLMIHKILGAWTIRSDSISSKYIQHTEAVLNMLNAHFESLQQEDGIPIRKWINRTHSKAWISCGRAVSLSGDREQGSKLYRRALSYDKFAMKAYAGILLNGIKH
jgi:Glycosyltransferases involved in cell wall biogenesis